MIHHDTSLVVPLVVPLDHWLYGCTIGCRFFFPSIFSPSQPPIQVSPSWYSPMRIPTDLVDPVARGRCWSTMAPNSKARLLKASMVDRPEGKAAGFQCVLLRFSFGFSWIFRKIMQEKGIHSVNFHFAGALGERLNNFKLVSLFHFWIAVANCKLGSYRSNMPGACVSESGQSIWTISIGGWPGALWHPLPSFGFTLSMRVVKVKLESPWSRVKAVMLLDTWSFR